MGFTSLVVTSLRLSGLGAWGFRVPPDLISGRVE